MIPSDCMDGDVAIAGEYLLGNFANEVRRLGFQHLIWSEGFHSLWRRGGVTADMHVLDAGCGPGFASFELARLVGSTGKVTALDFTSKYLEHLQAWVKGTATHNIDVVEANLHRMPLPDASCDIIFTKFVLLFIADLRSVLGEFVRVLRAGGKLLICDYWCGGSFSPPATPLNEFLALLRGMYRSRANLEVSQVLPSLLVEQGLQLEAVVPEVKVGRPVDQVWRWTVMFVEDALARLLSDGAIKQERAQRYYDALAQLTADPAALYCSPVMMQIVAAKPP